MDDLVRWLVAQLDEDERIARACSGAPWEIEIPPMVHVSVKARRDNKWKWGRLGYVATVERDDDRAHIAEWDPARVLRETDAKRRIIADYENYDREAPELDVPESVLRLLALPYSDREGYREEWRP